VPRSLRAAFVFLTRIPVGGFPFRAEERRAAVAWFPVVGLALGVLLATVHVLLSPLGPWAAASLTLGVQLLLTGGFHEDGLADTADGLGGAFDRAGVLRILKDSRVGAYGAMALMVALLSRVALLVTLGGAAPLGWVLSQSIARTPPVWLLWAMPYATPEGTARGRDLSSPSLRHVVFATLSATLLISVAMPLARGVSLTVALVTLALLCAWRFRVRVGGITGDFLGATEQLGEITVLAVLAW